MEEKLMNKISTANLMLRNKIEALKNMLDNPTPRVPIGLALDVSGSMDGEPITALNSGVERFMDELKNNTKSYYSAEVGIVTFASEAECVAEFNNVYNLTVPEMTAYGGTSMGEGVKMLLDMLEDRKDMYKKTGTDYFQPMLVIMSDGMPNGDPQIFREQAERIRRLVEAKKLWVMAVGIGENADMDELKKLSPKIPPMRIDHVHFSEFFRWLSASTVEVSTSKPGCESDMYDSELEKLKEEMWPTKTL